MTIDEADWQEFQRLYEEAYGEKLRDVEAQKAASSLAYLYEYLINHPVKEKQPTDPVPSP